MSIILGISLLLQFAAAIIAIRLIRVSGGRLAWILISMSISLMAVRRSISLAHLISGRLTQPLDPTFELVGLITSALMFVGVFLIAPLFVSIKKVEEKYHAASLYARSLIEASLDPLVTISQEGKITDVNKATEEVTGVPRDRLVGSDFSHYFTEPEKAQKGYQEVLAKGFVRDYPLSIRHKSGKVTDVLYNATVYRNEAGEIQGVFAAARDVTDRKRAEERIHESERKFRSLMESAPIGIGVTTAKGEILEVNSTMLKIFGYDSKEEFVKQPASAHYSDQKDREQFIELLKKGIVKDFEAKFRRKDGTVFFGSLTSIIQTPTTGTPQIISTFQDIAERKKNEERIIKLNRDLQRTANNLTAINKELEAFSFSVSHDLRTPLRSIDGFSQALMEDYTDILDEQGKDFLGRVRKAAQYMSLLIDDILKLSRITRSEMKHEKVDLSRLANKIAMEHKESQPGREIEFIVASGAVVKGDTRLLALALENLLANAWKFTGKHPRARIEFGITKLDHKPVYFVRDDGCGFDMAYVDKLFVPFQRLHTSAEFPGTGIGLAIVQRVINRHGGSVWAEGETEKGATFYFTL